MKRKPITELAAVTFGLMMSTGCMNREPAPVCPVPTELTSSNPTPAGFEGVDMVVVVDDSNSMQKEQEILATAFFPLINALVNPIPGNWEFEPTDDLRVAIVSSNMGLQWGGNAFNVATDGFPPAMVKEKCANPLGDNGRFKTEYAPGDGGSVNITPGEIECDAADPRISQCPPSWLCQNPDANGVGRCFPADGGDGSNQPCPTPPAALGSSYLTLKNTPADTDYIYEKNEFAMATACLSKLGINGCGFEQQLVAAAVGLEDPNQRDLFMRKNSLLVVLIVSDEEDCSIKLGPELFGSPEVQDNNSIAINTACGAHPEYLFSPAEIQERYLQAKKAVSGPAATGAVLFAAIVGVPQGPSPADPGPCQGTGDKLSACLEHEKMQLNVITNPDPAANGSKIFSYACERTEGTETVTEAAPGRRYVELAKNYGALSYVYSICNKDWSPAMNEIARLIAANVSGTCYAKRLDWDAASETAFCNAVVNVADTKCPTLPAGMAWLSEEQVGTEEFPQMACTIPKIPTPLECPDEGTEAYNALQAKIDSGFGWFYCENTKENYAESCSDGFDNDGEEGFDCQDSKCSACKACAADGVGDTELCPKKCQFMITFTTEALTQAKAGLEIQCRQQFSFEDPNCQENTASVCNDMEDNDGNGPYDCDNVSMSEATVDNPPRNADPHCCPISANQQEGAVCDVAPEDVTPICGEDRTDWPDACYEAADALNCILPEWK